MSRTLLALFVTGLLSACGGVGGPGPTPSTPVPAPLAGDWFSGTLSTIQYYDPVTGSWADPNGSGFYFIFRPDGTYEEGAVISSTEYTCSFRLLGRATGTVAVEGDVLTVYQQEGLTQVTNTCQGVGENVLGPKTTVYRWQVGLDEYGKEVLALYLPDGSLLGRFYRWE